MTTTTINELCLFHIDGTKGSINMQGSLNPYIF